MRVVSSIAVFGMSLNATVMIPVLGFRSISAALSIKERGLPSRTVIKLSAQISRDNRQSRRAPSGISVQRDPGSRSVGTIDKTPFLSQTSPSPPAFSTKCLQQSIRLLQRRLYRGPLTSVSVKFPFYLQTLMHAKISILEHMPRKKQFVRLEKQSFPYCYV